MPTKVATSNIKRGIGWEGLHSAANRLVGRNVDIIGFQEIFGARQKRLRKLMARRGYGVASSMGNPIAYDLKRYKRIDHDNRRIGPKLGSPFGAAKGNPSRYANFVALKDRRTGHVTVITNTHLGRHRTRRELIASRRQARALAEMQRELRKEYGDDASYYVTGDMNTARNLHLGLRNHHGKGHRIDRILSNRRMRGSALMETASDHDTFIGTFRDRQRKRGGKQANGQPGGKGDGRPGGKGGKGGGKNPKFDQSAYDLFADLLESWGIPVGSDIERIIRQAMIEGRTPDQIHLLIPDIQDTKTWKNRFPGWHDRVNNGYNQLNVEEYLQLENAYHRIMEEAGLPAGFYDDPSDFGKWIAQDVSPEEIGNRVGLAVDAAKKIDPTARDLMAKHYGLTTGDIASYFLDQDRALPVIQRQYQAANVASWAQRAGFNVNGMSRYEDLVDSGITVEQAAQSYGTVKSLADAAGSIAGVYGESYTQQDAEDDVFFGRDEKRRSLFSKERSTFSGSSRGSTGSAQRTGY